MHFLDHYVKYRKCQVVRYNYEGKSLHKLKRLRTLYRKIEQRNEP
ncbi:hypothetical protein EVA_10922 [gut metagenome]|uniref:Uncharacterized protein n=1 Tax=gut metagenome TaxID=749906 RepID=J9CLI6_9ZZZZ